MKVEAPSLWTVGRSLISWQDWFLLAGKVNGNHRWKWLNGHNTRHHK